MSDLKEMGWKTFASIPTKRIGSSTVILNGKAHVIGGRCRKGDKIYLTATHEVYDPSTDSWSKKAPLPVARGWGMVAVYNGRIYYFGGKESETTKYSSNTVYVYDPDGDLWKQKGSMPEARGNGGAAVIGDHISVFGGTKKDAAGLKYPTTTWRYDPAGDSWTRSANMPEGGNYIVTADYKDKIYAIHGCSAYHVLADDVLVYDPSINGWTKLDTPRFQKRKYPLTQVSSHTRIGEKVYLAGGCLDDGTRVGTVTYYDISEDKFYRVRDLPQKRCCGSGGVIDGKLYVFGGYYPGHYYAETWGYPFEVPFRQS